MANNSDCLLAYFIFPLFFIFYFFCTGLFLIGIEEYKIRDDGSILIDLTALDYVDG